MDEDSNNSNCDPEPKTNSKSPTPADQNPTKAEEQDDLTPDESSIKRRRKSQSVDETPASAADANGQSNLTIKNVADHVKRYEQEDREKKKQPAAASSDQMKQNGGAPKPIDVCSSVGSISLDEVVDNFSTMATDGSRQSLCEGSCEDERTKDQEKPTGGGDSTGNGMVQKDTIAKGLEDPPSSNTEPQPPDSPKADFFIQPEPTIGQEGPNNKGLDDDGNIVDPDEIGEPNEPGLGQWEPDYLTRRYPKPVVRGPSADSDGLSNDSTSRDRNRNAERNSVSSPGGGPALLFETANTSPAREDHGDDSLDEVIRRRFGRGRRSSSSDEEDSMMTSRSGEATGGSSTTAADGQWPMPPHKWNSVKAWRDREMGIPSTISPHWFRYRANGSLHFVQRLELMYKMEAHEGCVNCLQFNESGTRLASGSDDLNIIIWDWTTKTPLLTIESGHRANVFQAKFMPLSGDCHLVSCARDGQVRLAELSVRGVCKSTRKLAQHRGSSHKLTLETGSPHTFLSCGDDAVVFELDLRDPKPNKLLTCKERRTRGDGDAKVPLYSIHSHPRNSVYFAVSGRDPYCRIYDKRMVGDACEPVKKFCPQHLVDSEHKTNVTAVVFSHDGSELLGTYNDDDIYLFGTEQANENDFKHRYKGHRNNATVKGVNFYGPRSEFIVSGSDCGYIYFWEKESETIVQFLPGDEAGVVNVLEPHPTCAMLATSGLDHDVKIWVPSCEDPKFDVKLLQKLMRQNVVERERDRRNEPEYLDSQMLWYIMSRMRRAARRAQQGEGSDESGGDGSDDTDNTDGDDDAGDGPMAVQCRPS